MKHSKKLLAVSVSLILARVICSGIRISRFLVGALDPNPGVGSFDPETFEEDPIQIQILEDSGSSNTDTPSGSSLESLMEGGSNHETDE